MTSTGFINSALRGRAPSLESLALDEFGAVLGHALSPPTKQPGMKAHDRNAPMRDRYQRQQRGMTMEQYNARMNRGSANYTWHDSYDNIDAATDFLDDLIDLNEPTPYVRDHGAYQYRKAALNYQSTNHVAANMPAPDIANCKRKSRF